VLVAEGRTSEFSTDDLVTLIAGREVAAMQPEPRPPRPDTLLSVTGLSGTTLAELDFDLHVGEILGVAGLLGSGREELANLLVGAPPPATGRIAVEGRSISAISPRVALDAGLAMVPGDRTRSLVADLDVRENLTLPRLARLWRRWRLDRGAERTEAQAWIERMDVRPRTLSRRVAELSGGNQQKVALGKWLRVRPRVLVLDEPTRGVDVGAKAEIYRVIKEAAASGTGIVLCSSEAKELAMLCNRVLVLADGRQAAHLVGEAVDESTIVAATLR
jgi:ribose transport system ATP-binding protein